jgi:hypothetical protein
MKRIFFRNRFIFIPLGIAAFLGVISFAVMELWNNLLPAILHVGMITFWQAMGLFVLSKILFGFGKGRGFGGRRGVDGSWMRGRMEERFKNMTPEQKAKFKEKMNDRMCGYKSRFGRGGFENEWTDFAAEAENMAKPEEK